MVWACNTLNYKSGSIAPLLLVLLAFACTPDYQKNTPQYISEISTWQSLRIDSLKGKTGYLNLAGLFWLTPGENSIGSDSSNTFIFPEISPPFLGSFTLRNDSVWFKQSAETIVKISDVGSPDSALVYTPDGLMRSMRYKSLSWFVLQRGEDVGIRLKDYNHPLLDSFNHIDNYPIDAGWRVLATWEEYETPKMVIIKNQVGMDLDMPVYGAFNFELKGEQYTLEPVGELEGDTYFTMIFDETSGDTTYGSGRYIDVPKPNEKGEALLDFNKAYNPPCAFTEYATCTFPHAANRLPLRIEAGEKYTAEH